MMSMQVEKPRTSRSLGTTLAIAFVALSVAVLLVASGFQMFFNFQTQREVVASQQQLIAQDAANTVASFIQEKFSELEAVVALGDPTLASQEERESVVANLLGLDPAFRQLVLLDARDHKLAGVSRLSQVASGNLVDRADSDLFDQVRQRNRYIGSVYVDDVTSEPLVVIAVPATDVFGDFQGTLMAEVNLKFMWDLVGRLEIGERGLAYVVDRRGDLIAFGDVARVLKGESVGHLKEVSEFVSNPAPVDETGASISTGINGTAMVGTYVPLGTPDWAVVTELPVREAYREVIQSAVLSAGVILVMATLAGLVSVYVARRLAVPLLTLTETATRIAGGERGLQAAMEGPAEAVDLAKAFNSMTAQLRELIGSLKQRVAERTHSLRAAAQVAHATTSVLDPDELLCQTVDLIRERFDLYYVGLFLLDEEPSDSGHTFAVLCAGTGEAGQRMLEQGHGLKIGGESAISWCITNRKARIVLDAGQDAVRFANPLLPETRSELALPLISRGEAIGALTVQSSQEAAFIEEDITVLQTMADQLANAIANARLYEQAQQDITERKRAEEALKEYSERLEEMVEDRTQELRQAQEALIRKEKLAVLGQLAGGVGHELRNPLGAIKSAAYFLNMVLEEPDPEVKETLEILEKEVKASEMIISSLLDFARAKSPTRRKVDIKEVVQEALSRAAVPENVEVVSQLDGRLPTILADPDQLGQVFGNIILNAMQAMPEGGQLVVKTSEVSEKLPKSEWVAVSFTDTGVGIPEENLGKLFEPLFTTKAKGIGLGMAVTKTLVEGHDGRVEVESEVGVGTTFTVQLPISVG